jgi:TonB family protein
MRLLIAFLVVPVMAWAAPKFTTTLTVMVEGEAAGFKVDAKLDTCWSKPAKAKAKVTVENGKIAKVEIVENSDPRAKRCLEKALRAAKTDATAGVIATIDIEGAKLAAVLENAHNRKVLDIINKSPPIELGKLTGVDGGVGVGTSRGKGSGGGGRVEGDFVGTGKIDTGGPASHDANLELGGRSADDINRVIKSRAGVFRACYQKELNRTPKLPGGKIIVAFTIAPEGHVSRAATKSSTLNNAAVEKCVVTTVQRLKFPAAKAPAHVTYPFSFASM